MDDLKFHSALRESITILESHITRKNKLLKNVSEYLESEMCLGDCEKTGECNAFEGSPECQGKRLYDQIKKEIGG